MTPFRKARHLALLAEKARRQPTAPSKPFDPTPYTRGWQGAAVLDTARWQAWPAGRGAGKTRGAAYALLAAATAQPRVQVYYVSTSIKRAVATIWDDVAQLNADLKLGGTPNLTTHTLRFPNGSKLVVTGVENKTMANDLRGRQRCALWFLDEAQDWANDLLRYFYESVIYPRLGDVRGGVVFAGTGGPPRGYWYERTLDAEYSQHTATAFDNPAAPPGEIRELVDKACRDRGVTISDPSIQREFFAKFMADATRQIFSYEDRRNGYDVTDLPQGKWRYAIAGDFGTVDATAVHVWGFVDGSPHLWMIESEAKRGLGASEQVALVRDVVARYRARGAVVGVVGDPGGGGKGLIVDLQQQFDVDIVGAEKTQKAAACMLMRDALRNGTIRIPRTAKEFIEDLQSPEWDPDDIGKTIKGHMPDRIDAALYAFRLAAENHRFSPPKLKPTEEQMLAERIRTKYQNTDDDLF